MYLDEYKRWLAADLEDADLKPELSRIEGNDEEIKDRFAVALKFGTAGLRGVLGAGTNRMNIYVVRQATQGLANWVKTQGGSQTVAISYDSRLKSDVFAKTAAGVLAANGIKVRIYDALMPVPALSFATRYYECNAGIMVTASHNPAKYNGYKAYGPDGCQNTGSGLGKDITLKAAVIADGHRLGAALGLDPVCQALRGLTDHINVHPVGAGAQNAAQTGGAKFQCNRKAVFDLIVVSLNLCQLGLQVSVLKIRCQPALILFLIHVAHLTFIVFCQENGSFISLIII